MLDSNTTVKVRAIADDRGFVAFQFQDSEICDKFCAQIAKVSAERYVIDRMIEGVSQSLLKDLNSGALSDVDPLGLDVDSPGNVLKIAVKFLASLVLENAKNRDNTWELAHQSGLPSEIDWSFDILTKTFSREA